MVEQNELVQPLVLSASDVSGAGRSRSGRSERCESSACSCPGRASSTLVDRAKVLGFQAETRALKSEVLPTAGGSSTWDRCVGDRPGDRTHNLEVGLDLAAPILVVLDLLCGSSVVNC